MKRMIFLLALVGVLVAGAASAAITGTDHDLSGAATETDELCVYCHTPHQFSDWPLWNRGDSTATFTAYSSFAINMTIETNFGSAAGTGSCLSCHDGTVSYDTIGNVPGPGCDGAGGLDCTPIDRGFTMAGGDLMPSTSSAFIGTDLSVHHPVNVVFNQSKDTEFNTPDGTGSFGNTHLIQGRVACGSCHDVHNTPEVAPFLIGSNSGSALCIECHTK